MRVQTMRAFVCATEADEPRGRAGDSAEPADEVERDALGREHAARRPFDDRERRSGGDLGAVGEARLEADRRVDEAEGVGGEIESGDDALLPARP